MNILVLRVSLKEKFIEKRNTNSLRGAIHDPFIYLRNYIRRIKTDVSTRIVVDPIYRIEGKNEENY